MTLVLKAQIIVTGKCTSGSKHQLVKSLQRGDVLEFSTTIKPIGRNSGSLYATYVTVKNLTRPEVQPYLDSITLAAKLLARIPHTEIDND